MTAEEMKITPKDAILFAFYMQDRAEAEFKKSGSFDHFSQGMIGIKFFEWLNLHPNEKYCIPLGGLMPKRYMQEYEAKKNTQTPEI